MEVMAVVIDGLRLRPRAARLLRLPRAMRLEVTRAVTTEEAVMAGSRQQAWRGGNQGAGRCGGSNGENDGERRSSFALLPQTVGLPIKVHFLPLCPPHPRKGWESETVAR